MESKNKLYCVYSCIQGKDTQKIVAVLCESVSTVDWEEKEREETWTEIARSLESQTMGAMLQQVPPSKSAMQLYLNSLVISRVLYYFF